MAATAESGGQLAPFGWNNPYPTTRSPVFARHVVATSQPLAAQAGLALLQQGGTAIDAAVAGAAVIALTEPVSNGLGSDCFAIVWDGQGLHGLNASGWSPKAWDRAYFERVNRGQIPTRGWHSVTVPGCVAGWIALHQRWGKRPLADVLAPAIGYAHRGFAVSAIVGRKWAAQIAELKDQPGFAEHFMPNRRAPAVGQHFVLRGAAATLERIADSGGRDYYEGETAAALVRHSQAHGAALAADDLADYRPEWVAPMSVPWGNYRLHELPPNGQGIAALMALGMLRELGLESLDPDSVAARHLQIEAMKLAFADVYEYVADPAHMTISPEALIDPGYLADRARLIRHERAREFRPGQPPPTGGTIYLTAADASGMMVSFIQSNYQGFGSGVVVPGTGVSLQNRGTGFNVEPGHPNCVMPRKRPFQTIIPAFLTHHDQPQMSFGVMGGNMQPQGHLQTLLRILCWGQNPQAACDAPRFKVMTGREVALEDTLAPSVVEGLRARGHRLIQATDTYMDFGSGQFIWRLGVPAIDGYVAASDSRRDGLAAGF